MNSFRESAYRRAQAGMRLAVTNSDFRWMQLQYDDFFFYDGVPWKLVGVAKGGGVVIVRRERVGGVEEPS